MKKIFFLSLLCGLAVATAKGQTENPDTNALHFIIKVSIGNVHEISSGQLAAQKAQSTDVKAFGKRMIADHNDAQAKLLQLAKTKGYNIPAEATDAPVPDPVLVKASGSDFDRLYIHIMLPDHRNTVLMVENYAVTGKDPDVKAWAQQTLPILKAHLASIKQIDQEHKDLIAK